MRFILTLEWNHFSNWKTKTITRLIVNEWILNVSMEMLESIYRILSIRDIKWILHVSPGEENKSGFKYSLGLKTASKGLMPI